MDMDLKAKLLERFLRYVSFDTMSVEGSNTFPSTTAQREFLGYLANEMRTMGIRDVEQDEYGYVMGTVPGTASGADSAQVPTIGLLAHVDTSPDFSGRSVRPQIIQNYTGGDIALGASGYLLTPGDFPELLDLRGHTLITTDGATLLGADDKAGVAIILTAAEYLLHFQDVKRAKIRIGFTPDEEIGRGVDHFDIARFGAQYAYTVDGGALGQLEYENFNAAFARFTIAGLGIHPGVAKDKMINAIQVAAWLHAQLPEHQRPELTQGYEGFYHPVSVTGSVEGATFEYIVREHDTERFEQMKQTLQGLAAAANARYGAGTVSLEIREQYRNMRQVVERDFRGVELAREAMQMLDIKPIECPVRGGTDGARLAFMGLPCPNLFTGGANFHGRYEYASLQVMEQAVQTIVKLAELWAAERGKEA